MKLLEDQRFTNAKALRDFLNAYSDTELDTMYPLHDAEVRMRVFECELSDGSTVRDFKIEGISE